MKIDLHIHSIESDGSLDIPDIIELANQADVKVMALTDHESTDGIETAQKLAQSKGIKIIPGIEFSSHYQGQEIHLLGYFADINNNMLQNRLATLRQQRTILAQDMVRVLQQDGYHITWEDVIHENKKSIAIGKGHIMRTLYLKCANENNLTWPVIATMFQPGGSAYLPFLQNSSEEAIDLICQTGGIPVLAHPGLIRKQEMIEDILSLGNIGLEVYYGYWERQSELIAYYFRLAESKDLLMTGGSDFHGPFSKVGIGQIDVPKECIDRLLSLIDI